MIIPETMTTLLLYVTVAFILNSIETRASPLSGHGGNTKSTYTREFTRGSYRAAVFEHAVVTPIVMAKTHTEAVSQMMVNLREYERQVNVARQQNVDIIVFPEDGIYGFIRNHLDLRHYIEDIPDPKAVSWNPCEDPTRFPQSLQVVTFLSCLAKNNSLYLVANYGDAKPCSTLDPNCPDDGQYQFNTDLAFDRQGQLIAKYHKQNLFYEKQFDEPIVPEYAYFDTPFGRFGMFTCFDILFHEPMVPLLTIYNVTDIAFPTAWRDVMPYYSAIGYHSSVAAAYNVNLLSANIHHPSLRFQGSGIYTPGGANAFYYDRTAFVGKLVISDVDSITQPMNPTGGDGAKNDNGARSRGDYDGASVFGQSFRSDVYIMSQLNSKTDTLVTEHDGPVFPRPNLTEQTPLMAAVFDDWYHVVLLNESSANVSVCQRGLCCSLEYETDGISDLYAFGVFNGKHIEQGEYYLQVCLLLTCASNDVTTCGQSTFSASTTFRSVRMSGSFETRFVTPQIILTDDGSLRLPQKGSMKYENGQLLGRDTSYPLLEACLFGRFYERD